MPNARLATTSILTLTGPGGVGKTRLALEVGAHLVERYPGGVWYIELATLNDGALIGDTIASALQLKQATAGAIPALLSALSDRRVLLILDNCEHLLDPVVDVADQLLRRCPDLRIVATSREALGMSGESLMPVPSMSLPESAGPGSPEAFERLAACDAVRLFIDRGRAVLPGFELTEENAEAIAQICLRLDGIPLAVELAAARVRSLPPHQIAARLDNRFRLLTGGSRTALPRHRTLRAAMDWSFDMLGEAEQVLLPRLSAFAGSFSIDAAEAVAAGGPVNSDEMVDLLARLVDKSLLMPEEGSTEARYRMLETVRDYAQERLVEAGEASEVYGRHRDWFVALVAQARPGFFDGPEQAAWLARLSDDHDNLRAALRWSDEDPDGGSAELSLASGLWRFWEIRGHLAEGSAWLDRALARTGGEISARRALGLTGVGVLATQRGDLAAASAAHEASLLLHRELGNPNAIAAACSNVASASIEQGNFDRARELYREAVGLSRATATCRGPPSACSTLPTCRLGWETTPRRTTSTRRASRPSRRSATCGAWRTPPRGWRWSAGDAATSRPHGAATRTRWLSIAASATAAPRRACLRDWATSAPRKGTRRRSGFVPREPRAAQPARRPGRHRCRCSSGWRGSPRRSQSARRGSLAWPPASESRSGRRCQPRHRPSSTSSSPGSSGRSVPMCSSPRWSRADGRPCKRRSPTRRRSSDSAALGDLEEPIREEPVGQAVDFLGRLRARCIHETEDLAGGFVEPVAEVVDAIGRAHLDVASVRVRERIGLEVRDVVVLVQIEWHSPSRCCFEVPLRASYERGPTHKRQPPDTQGVRHSVAGLP